LATLSRYPISGWEHLFLPTVEGWEQRGMLDTRIDVPGIGEIAVINTHLQVGGSGEVEEASWQRVGQSRAIADHIATLDIPVIVLGDFNCEADSGDIDPLMGPDSGLTDVWSAAAGPGKTFFDGASGEHVARIDYVLVSHHFSVETAEVIDKERSCLASDHFPLVAELRFVGSAVPDNLS
jgi:endonuclease/exonuclease/phosphatase family metal-dependent hydrolase